MYTDKNGERILPTEQLKELMEEKPIIYVKHVNYDYNFELHFLSELPTNLHETSNKIRCLNDLYREHTGFDFGPYDKPSKRRKRLQRMLLAFSG